jgi:hypothetical protein
MGHVEPLKPGTKWPSCPNVMAQKFELWLLFIESEVGKKGNLIRIVPPHDRIYFCVYGRMGGEKQPSRTSRKTRPCKMVWRVGGRLNKRLIRYSHLLLVIFTHK